MSRKTPAKEVEPSATSGRWEKALAFHKAARGTLEATNDGEVADPVISQIVLAAIAYADALTAKFGRKVNQKDHARVVDLLAEVLAGELPKEQSTRLKRMLSKKVQYGAEATRARADAAALLVDLDRFAAYAESLLKR